MTLWLVRHARPLVAPGVCYGASDVAVDAVHTHAVAQQLATHLPHRIGLLSSPAQRCVQLAQQLQMLRPDLVCHVDARLAEMDFGRWEGVPWEQIPRSELDAWSGNFAHYRFGGVESASEVMWRVAQAWDDYMALTAAQGTALLWVTHAGVLRAASLLARGVRQVREATDWPACAFPYGACWQLRGTELMALPV